MGRKKAGSYVDEKTLRVAEKDLEAVPYSKVSMRLLAIIGAGRGKQLKEIASLMLVSRQCVADWIRKYKNDGIDGLYNNPKGHRIKRLTPQQEKQIQGWLDRGESPQGAPYHWTMDKIKAAIEERFGVILSRSRVGYLVQEWGFSPKVPRPRHAGSDKAAQEAFKKNSAKRL